MKLVDSGLRLVVCGQWLVASGQSNSVRASQTSDGRLKQPRKGAEIVMVVRLMRVFAGMRFPGGDQGGSRRIKPNQTGSNLFSGCGVARPHPGLSPRRGCLLGRAGCGGRSRWDGDSNSVQPNQTKSNLPGEIMIMITIRSCYPKVETVLARSNPVRPNQTKSKLRGVFT
jgi:hypothetical protein